MKTSMNTYTLLHGAKLLYDPQFIDITDDEYDELVSYRPETRHNIRIFGKTIPIPRYQQAYGVSYAYSGTVSEAIDMPPLLIKIRDAVSEIYPQIEFNNCLVNWYLTGDHYISNHSDDEAQIIPGTPIVGITFCKGTARTLRIKDKITGKTVQDILTTNSSFYAMDGPFQKHYTHGIPKTKRQSERISLTFRSFHD